MCYGKPGGESLGIVCQSNEALIVDLKSRGVLRSARIEEALRIVDRKTFVPPQFNPRAYGDFPLPLPGGQSISQPRTAVFTIELLQPASGDKLLDVGSGSGWTTALLAELVGPCGSVTGIEKRPELVTLGREHLAQFDYPNARILAAGSVLGYPQDAPYDKILVSAAARRKPKVLLEQLNMGGTMVIPVRKSIWQIRKTMAGVVEEKEYPGFLFVELVEE